MAYTRYANAARLNISDSSVMVAPYTRSHSATNPTIVANVANPNITIPIVSIIVSVASPGAGLVANHPDAADERGVLISAQISRTVPSRKE